VTHPVGPTGPTEHGAEVVAAVQATIADDRARLLKGRGPGVSAREIERNTRARLQVGGDATPQHLQAVAHQTALARGEATALARDIATTRDDLGASLHAIGQTLRPQQAITRGIRAATATVGDGQSPWAAMAGGRARIVAAVSVLIIVVLLRRRH